VYCQRKQIIQGEERVLLLTKSGLHFTN